MDFEHTNAKQKASILQGDDFIFNRIISRNSSLGHSSRVFYCRSSEGVPFQWEMQPGTPKDPPQQDFLPPLSPPPAVISYALPKPCIDIREPDDKAFSIWSRLKFWKYILKVGAIRKACNGYKRKNHKENLCSDQQILTHTGSDKFERFKFYNFDEDLMVSARNSSFSSSSASLSFSNGNSSQLSRSESKPSTDSIHGIVFGCSPWNFTSSLVSVARRA